MYSGLDKVTGEVCAVKVVTKKTMTKAKIAEVRRECRVMRELQALPHPNLVRMKDGFEDRRNIYIIMELYASYPRRRVRSRPVARPWGAHTHARARPQRRPRP